MIFASIIYKQQNKSLLSVNVLWVYLLDLLIIIRNSSDVPNSGFSCPSSSTPTWSKVLSVTRSWAEKGWRPGLLKTWSQTWSETFLCSKPGHRQDVWPGQSTGIWAFADSNSPSLPALIQTTAYKNSILASYLLDTASSKLHVLFGFPHKAYTELQHNNSAALHATISSSSSATFVQKGGTW